MKLYQWLTTVMIGIIASNTTVSSDEIQKNRFLKEYPEASRQLAERLSMVRGSYWSKGSNGESETFFAVDHGKEKVHSTQTYINKGNERTIETVFILREESYFKIERKQQTGPYLLKSMSSDMNDSMTYQNYEGSIHNLALGCRPLPLMRLLNSDHFELGDVVTLDSDPGLVKINFTYGISKPKRKCTMVLDPDNHWAARTITEQNENSKQIDYQAELEYGEKTNGFSLPKQLKLMNNGRLNAPIVFKDWKFVATPDKEFTLSYYGLPDLKPPSHKNGWSKYVWISVLLSLAFSILLYLLLRTNPRSKSMSATKIKGKQ